MNIENYALGLKFENPPMIFSLKAVTFSFLVSACLVGCSDPEQHQIKDSVDPKSSEQKLGNGEGAIISPLILPAIPEKNRKVSINGKILASDSDEGEILDDSKVEEHIGTLTSSLTGRELSRSLASYLDGMQDTSTAHIVSALEALPPGSVSELALLRGAALLYESDPVVAADWISRSAELTELERSAMLDSVGYMWAADDPGAALNYAKTLHGEKSKLGESFASEVINSWVNADVQSALQEIQALAVESPDLVVKVLPFPSTIASLLRESEGFLTSLSSNLDSNIESNSSFLHAVGSAWADVDPKRGMEWLEGESKLDAQSTNTERDSLFGKWIRNFPSDALTWAEKINNPNVQKRLIESNLVAIERIDPSSAEVWSSFIKNR